LVIYEQVFDDTTGIRLVTLPNEKIKREEVVLQMRIQVAPNTVKMVKCALTDPKTGEDLFPLLEEALLKNKLREVGRKCDHCKEYFLPTSPNQKHCVTCKDMLRTTKTGPATEIIQEIDADVVE
jgi:hypothetical protein